MLIFYNMDKLGEHFGYPSCCIEFFKTQEHITIHLSLYEELLPKSGINNTGFIPCPHHLRLLCDNKVTILELLKERKCETPFPFHRRYTCAECLIRAKHTMAWLKKKEDHEHSALSRAKRAKK